MFSFNSLALSRYACIRAVAQHKVTFRIASSSLARFVIARVAYSRHARLPPAVSLLSLTFSRQSSTAKYFALRTQTRASVALRAAVVCVRARAVWVEQAKAMRVMGDKMKTVIPRRSFRCVCAYIPLSVFLSRFLSEMLLLQLVSKLSPAAVFFRARTRAFLDYVRRRRRLWELE
jgi:hypothetical protein